VLLAGQRDLDPEVTDQDRRLWARSLVSLHISYQARASF
jgi:hypothetical protein